MPKVNVTFIYNNEGEDGEKITQWLLAQDNVSASIRRLILKKPLSTDGIVELRREVKRLADEVDGIKRRIDK